MDFPMCIRVLGAGRMREEWRRNMGYTAAVTVIVAGAFNTYREVLEGTQKICKCCEINVLMW